MLTTTNNRTTGGSVAAWSSMARITLPHPSRLTLLSPKLLLSAAFIVLSLFVFLNTSTFGTDEKGVVLRKHVSAGQALGGLRNEVKSKIIKSHDTIRGNEPISSEEVVDFLSSFIRRLRVELTAYSKEKEITYHEVWRIYHDLAAKILYPWDLQYLRRMPTRKKDGSIFLSVASYRDENCVNTLKLAYTKADHPEKLYIGLVQQNCEQDCKTGVLENRKVEDTVPDEDCHVVFCDSKEGKEHCKAGRVRALHIEESESLGPYAARYFASKLWSGEQWFMQIDSHMTFAQGWDTSSINMLNDAPSDKPIISHYPPSETTDFERARMTPAPRICGPTFASSPIEAQIIRLEGSGQYESDKKVGLPRFAPFVAAGYFVAHSDFLREVPFDPFLPWIFMGEEIIMSARFWTAGYDIFSPSYCVVGHIYVRRNKPKFWESIGRMFRVGFHNPLQVLVLQRIKMQLGYPESAQDIVKPKSLFTGIHHYTMGSERTIDEYMDMIGMDPTAKLEWNTQWCESGQPPEYANDRAQHYD